jgi:hypothetical protein
MLERNVYGACSAGLAKDGGGLENRYSVTRIVGSNCTLSGFSSLEAIIDVPKEFAIEFRRDVVARARKGEAPLSQIGKRLTASSRPPPAR